MNDAEFRADLLSAAAARAESAAISLREGFVVEVLERLREAGETPDFESCPEQVIGQRQAKLEMDAFAYDDADDSLHLFLALRNGGESTPPVLTLTEVRDTGFNRLMRLYEHARDGWLRSIEISRPLWSFARRIEVEPAPAALRLNILSDRPISERIREIAPDFTREGTPVTFQIWDITRLKRIHEAANARDDLIVNLSGLPGGGLQMLRAASGEDYEAWLGVIPGEFLADIYLQHGSRLLEGNVRTFLGRRGNVNRGIAETLARAPLRFFAYNNGIAATASSVSVRSSESGATIITDITDMQIVNGAQTTASLAALRREKNLPEGRVSVPLKLSVVPTSAADALVPLISRFANSQNAIRASDFFANHPFHQRVQEISRRILAPAAGARQVQTRWYYERARGQYLNDQAGFSKAQKDQFERINPRQQVITKTDLAKVESSFDLLPDIVCKGAEKAFVDFAERVSARWADDNGPDTFSDDWYKSAVARVILFRAAEAQVSKASWYEGGYRAQIVAYTCARFSQLAIELSSAGSLDWLRIWSRQEVGDCLSAQLLVTAERMSRVLRSPPRDGMNVTEWAKQQACRARAFQTPVAVVDGFGDWLITGDGVRVGRRPNRAGQP